MTVSSTLRHFICFSRTLFRPQAKTIRYLAGGFSVRTNSQSIIAGKISGVQRSGGEQEEKGHCQAGWSYGYALGSSDLFHLSILPGEILVGLSFAIYPHANTFHPKPSFELGQFEPYRALFNN
jgi:hypothetical protein